MSESTASFGDLTPASIREFDRPRAVPRRAFPRRFIRRRPFLRRDPHFFDDTSEFGTGAVDDPEE